MPDLTDGRLLASHAQAGAALADRDRALHNAVDRPALRGRRSRPRSVRAVKGAAVEVAGRKRLAAIVAVLLVVGVVVATVGRVFNEPVRVGGELLLVVVAVGGAWVALTTTKAVGGPP